jgi:hypothetical protein
VFRLGQLGEHPLKDLLILGGPLGDHGGLLYADLEEGRVHVFYPGGRTYLGLVRTFFWSRDFLKKLFLSTKDVFKK